MKLTNLLSLVFSGLFCSGLLLAQNPLDFFPHHLGDLWEYWVEQYPGSYIIEQNEITEDSLGSDGRYYIEFDGSGYFFILDTTTFEVYVSYYGILYKLDADSGDSWVVFEDSSGQHQEIAVVSDVYPALLFNQPVTVKVIDYYAYTIGVPESLWTQTYYLASNFGMVQRDVEFAAPYYLIRGAIIDSVLYGNVTSIERVDKKNIPKTPILSQNYPNPFNPKTMIQYDLPTAAKVELTVYDLLGRQVRRLVNAPQQPGTYRVEFDGRNLSSGVYFYRLRTNSRTVLSRKMVLMK